MEDAADLVFSAFEKGIDKYHDSVYDGVSQKTQKLKSRKQRKYTEEPTGDGGIKTTAEETTHYYPEDDKQNPDAQHPEDQFPEDRYHPYRQQPNQYQFNQSQPNRYQSNQYQSKSRMAQKDNYEDSNQRSGGYGHDSYDPEIGMARGVGRDGYAAPEELDSRSAYNGDYRRGSKGRSPRYLEYPPDGSRYGQGGAYESRHRSNDDLRSRKYDDEYSDYDDDEEPERSRAVDRRGSRSSISKSRGAKSSRDGDRKGGNDEDNPKWQEWGATLAGAAVGAYGVHRGMGRHSNGKGYGGGEEWIPAVIGAVVGGLVGRGAEKEWKKRNDRHRELDNRLENVYRSKSR